MAMRREQNEAREYAMVRLYLDDVEEIERVLTELAAPPNMQADIQVSNGEWTSDTVAELLTKAGAGPFTDFKVTRHHPGLISLEVGPTSTRLYVSDIHDLQLRGAYEKIDATVRRARLGPVARFVIDSWGANLVFQIPAALAFFAGVYFAAESGDKRMWGLVTSLAILIYGIAGMVAAWRIALGKNGQVLLVHRASSPGFLKRNKDQLLVGLICAVLGGAIGTVVGVAIGG